MKKIERKGTSGITLIALVITIIVLLILAGISITMLAGDNSILNQAGRARDTSRGGAVQETVRLEATNNNSIDYTGGTKKTRAEVINELHSAGKITDEELELLTDEENPVDVITIGGITIDFSVLDTVSSPKKLTAMFQQAVTDGCTNADGTCTREDHLHIGDYVNYTNPTSGEWTVPAGELGGTYSQTYLVSQNQLNWRVLGIEGTGNNAYIKIIAGSPMKKSKADKSEVDEENPYLYMKGAKAYLNAINQLNKICAMYKNETLAVKAESVNIDDINKITGVTTDDLKRQYNLDQFDGNKNYGESYSFSNQYTPTSWTAEPRVTTTVLGNVEGYYYSINQPAREGAPYVSISNARINNMLFNDEELSSGKQYWLASVGTYSNPYFASFAVAGIGKKYGVVFVVFDNLFHANDRFGS